MGTRRCCCTRGCVIAADDFNRPDTMPPSGDWLVIDGAWDVLDNELQSASPGPVVTTIRQAASTRPNTDYSIKIFFKLTHVGVGRTEFGVICGYQDEDNFHWVKLEVIGTSIWPTFYVRAGGTDTVLLDRFTHPGGIGFPYDTSGHTWDGKICFSKADWTVDAAFGGSIESGNGIANTGSETTWTYTGGIGQASLPVISGTPPTPIGMVGFLYGAFDNWAFHYHWEANVTCDYCSCICRNPDNIDDYAQLPELLLATIVPQFSPSAYPCSINFAQFLLKQGVLDTFGVHNKSPRKFVWTNDAPPVVGSTPSDTRLFFYCDGSGGPDTWKLCLLIPSSTGSYTWGDPIAGIIGGAACARVDWTDSSCDPLSMTFGDLYTGYTTCEIGGPGSGIQGIKSPLCQGSGCIAENSSNIALIESLRWKIIITEP